MSRDLTDDEWRELIERAPDRFKPKRYARRSRIDRRAYGEPERQKITLPRLKFMEKPDDD